MINYERGEYNFKKDLIKGERGEDFIIIFMEKLGFQFINKCNDNRYDVMMGYNGCSYTYEIKTDSYPRDTGNIAIEVESRGKPSGISVTKADFFVTYFPNIGEIWNIKSSNLLKLINEKSDSFRFVENAGDLDSNTKLYLINKSKFKKYFKVHQLH